MAHTGYMNNHLHAHVSTASRDCDGPVYRDRIEGFNPDECAEQVRAYFNGIMRGYDDAVNDFSEINFMDRMMVSVASPYAVSIGMRVTVTDEGIEVYEDTDEGSRSAYVRWCRDDCDMSVSHYRDVYAEQMGY